jgi:NAD(P) transhydrogenase subunit beta
MVLKRSLAPGFAGEDNELFYDKKTMMVFGDAKTTLTTLVQLLKKSSAAPADKAKVEARTVSG